MFHPKIVISTGPKPDMSGAFDTFLQLFDKDKPLIPVYKAFKGAKQLCIGEKKGNIAYLYIVYEDGVYWLIGKPNAGRDDHLPKLKIRDQDRRRLGGSSSKSDKYNKGSDVIVRFRDGPGTVNSLWEIFSNGYSETSSDANWYLVPNKNLCIDNNAICPIGETCNPLTGSCVTTPDKCTGVPCKVNEKCVLGKCVGLCFGVTCGPFQTCDPADGVCKIAPTPSPVPPTPPPPTLQDQNIPAIAVLDEDSNFDKSICGDQESCWNIFRQRYPTRPFCLLGYRRRNGDPTDIDTPPNFLADTNKVYVRNLERDCDRDGKNCDAGYDWLSICGLDNISTPTVEIVGLSLDDSGSFTYKEVEPSIERMIYTLENKGIATYYKFMDGENWIADFLTDILPNMSVMTTKAMKAGALSSF